MTKYNYATVNIDTHGFLIRTNHNVDVEYASTSEPYESNGATWMRLVDTNGVVYLASEENKLVYDRRSHDHRSMIMVYKHGLTEQEVLDLLHPQMKEMLDLTVKMYQLFAKNAEEMRAAVESTLPIDHFCAPGWGEKEKE